MTLTSSNIATGLFVILSGCSATPNMPLIFGQSQTVGITLGGSATTDQGAEFTFGYKDKNFAVIPATVSQADGGSTQVKSTASPGFEDALSVLGQFEVNTKTDSANVALGKFFATGTAAKTLADGFKAKLSGAPVQAASPAVPAASAPVSTASAGAAVPAVSK